MPLVSKHRRIFSVTSSLQYRFLAMTLAYGFIIVSLFVLGVVGPDVSEMRNESLNPDIRSSAAQRVLEKSTWIWPAALAMIALLGVHSFFEFNRVMGPLYRFQWAFKQLGAGNLLPTVTTRKKDYLKAELASLNEMNGAIEQHVRAIKRESEAALSSVADLESSFDSRRDLSPVQLELLQNHRKHVELLADAVRFFRLPDEQPNGVEIQQETSTNEYKAAKEGKNGISQPASG